jgi:hypothetical protein
MFKLGGSGHYSSSHKNAPRPPPPVRSHVEGEEFQRDDRQIRPAEIGITSARIRPDAVEKPPPRRYSAKDKAIGLRLSRTRAPSAGELSIKLLPLSIALSASRRRYRSCEIA